MSFLVRIFFSGLMAFVPSQDGTELTVVLLNSPHSYQVSDGSSIPHHSPLVIARAGSCSGTCPKRDSSVAEIAFNDLSLSAAQDALETAVDGGGAWMLSGSELSLRKGNSSAPNLPALNMRDDARTAGDIIPTTSSEREDLSWIPDFKQIAPSGYVFNTAVLDAQPPSGLVAARFRLRNGKVYSYSIARIGTDVTPVHFGRLDGQGGVSPYSQAVSTWVAADIEVSGENIELVEEKFDGSTGRTMTLTPDASGKIELAVLNMPPYVPPTTPFVGTPAPGKHFERYYDLATNPIAQEERLVPKAGAALTTTTYPSVTWQSIHPQNTLWSELLNQLRLNPGRGMAEPVLCPPIKP